MGWARMVQRYHQVTAVEHEWDELADRTSAPPWLRAGWLRPWHDAFGKAPLEAAILRRDGRITALVPLEVAGSELRSPTNYHTPGFGLLAESPDDGAALMAGLLEDAPRRVSLAFVPITAATRTLARIGSSRAGRTWHERVLERCPFLDVDGDWDAYLGRRRGHLVRELRRRRRKLERDGTLELEVVGEHDVPPDQLDAALEDVFRVEASGWKGERGTAIGATPATRAFYTAIARWLAARGWLRLAILRHGARPIAVDFAVEAYGTHSLIKTGFDPALRSVSPGMLLRQQMLERAFRGGMHRYDFLGIAESWKREWTDLTEPYLLLQSFDASPAGHADRAAQRFGRPLARRLLRRGAA
jgi:CelD/BcsL family acetyltransferase involved in cellulose biosynthesis